MGGLRIVYVGRLSVMWHVSFCQHALYRIRKVRGMDVEHRGPPGLCTKKWHSRNIKPYQRKFDLNLRCASPFKILIILSKTYMHNVSHGQVTEDNVSHVKVEVKPETDKTDDKTIQ